MFTGALLVGVGVVTGVFTRVGRHKFGVVAGEPWRWWLRASGIAVTGGTVLLFVGDKSTGGFATTIITALGFLVCISRWGYLMDVAGAGRRVIVVDATREWPLEVVEGNAQRPLELGELRLRRELLAQLRPWTSVPPAQRKQGWRIRGEMLLEHLDMEVGGGRWWVDRGSLRAG